MNVGVKVMDNFTEAVAAAGSVEKRPTLEGRSLTMILTPKSEKIEK